MRESYTTPPNAPERKTQSFFPEMHEPAPFHVTPEAGAQLVRLLRSPPAMEAPLIGTALMGMEAALILVFGFEESDGNGPSARFNGEHFVVGFYSPGQVKGWSRFDVFGHSLLVEPHALERLRARTLAIKTHDVGVEPGKKEERELLVVS